MGHKIINDNGNTCKRKEHTSNSGLSSKMGRVTEVSSLCLDCKKEETTRREISKHAYGVSRKMIL